MEEYTRGERVRGTGIGSGGLFEGVVTRGTFNSYFGSEARILVTKVIKEGPQGGGASVGQHAGIRNVERIKEVKSGSLVGPKPKPPVEPEHPTPWSVSGNTLYDANGTVVFRIGNPAYANTMAPEKAKKLAIVVRDAVNEAYSVEDAPAPW